MGRPWSGLCTDSVRLDRVATRVAHSRIVPSHSRVNLATGYCGLISLGHGAFVGIGAFGTAWFVDSGGMPWAVAIVGGVLVAALGGLVIGAQLSEFAESTLLS